MKGNGEIPAFDPLPGPLVSAAWLAQHLNSGVTVVDATVLLAQPERDGDFRAESGLGRFIDGHIPGAKFADLLGEFSDHRSTVHFTRPQPETLARALVRLGVRRGSIVVSYDSESGLWACRLWWMLRAIGIPAAVLDGGWNAWLASGGPVETGTPDRCAAGERERSGEDDVPFPEVRSGLSGLWADLPDVEAVVAGEQPGVLVCALSPEVFAGVAPSRYARRGHIPGSLNVPARSLLDEEGRFLDRTRLVAALEPLTTRDGPVVAYCGGGISASLLALALVLVGREDVSVYDGSLDEWSAQPNLPLVLGEPC